VVFWTASAISAVLVLAAIWVYIVFGTTNSLTAPPNRLESVTLLILAALIWLLEKAIKYIFNPKLEVDNKNNTSPN
jgi:hypothetical protein